MLLATLALGACGGATAGESARSPSPTAASAAPLTVQIQSMGVLGFVLTDPAGLTLYYFEQDEPASGRSNCDAGCAAAWPPVTATDVALAKPEVLPGAVATITRSDGTRQVTYEGRPLYRSAADRAPGEVKGQSIASWAPASVELLCDCGEH